MYFYGLIEEVVLLLDVEIKCYCCLCKVIIDCGCVILEGMVIGYDYDEDCCRGFWVLFKGVVLVICEMLG